VVAGTSAVPAETVVTVELGTQLETVGLVALVGMVQISTAMVATAVMVEFVVVLVDQVVQPGQDLVLQGFKEMMV
jgi:hypothetical protein